MELSDADKESTSPRMGVVVASTLYQTKTRADDFNEFSSEPAWLSPSLSWDIGERFEGYQSLVGHGLPTNLTYEAQACPPLGSNKGHGLLSETEWFCSFIENHNHMYVSSFGSRLNATD